MDTSVKFVLVDKKMFNLELGDRSISFWE